MNSNDLRTFAAIALLVLLGVGLAVGGVWVYNTFILAPPVAAPPPEPPEDVAPAASDEAPRFAGIAGVFVDHEGQPLREFLFAYALEGSLDRKSVTDGEGRFELKALAGGKYRFSVLHKGSSIEEQAATYRVRNPLVEVAPGEEKTGVEVVVEIQVPGLVAGAVRDAEGKPIAGAEVDHDPKMTSPVATGEDGAFLLPLPQKEGTVDLLVRWGNYGDHRVEGVAVGTQDLEVVLERGGRLKGRVQVKETGAPVPDFEFTIKMEQAFTEEYALPEFKKAISDPDGRFDLGGIAPGRIKLAVEAAGFARELRTFELDNGAVLRKVIIEMGEAQGFRGLVVDKDSRKGIPNARVYIGPLPDVEYDATHAAQTDAHGSFTIPDLPEGDVVLGVAPERDYGPKQFTVNSAASPVTLELVKSGRLHGYVTNGGQPIDGAPVTVYARQEDADSIFIRRVRTDREGFYEFTTVPPGAYTAEAANPENPDDFFRRTRIEIEDGFDIRYDFKF